MTRVPQQIPDAIGRYRIESWIGGGGMGDVFKAYDTKLERTVALKTIKSGANDPVFLERLKREATACARLRHPNIITVHDLGEVDGVVFIAMEYLEGESLAAAIEGGALPFDAKLQVLIQVLDALEYAHRQGVIHRDVKPTNIHLLPDRTIKLLDFGIARVARADSLTVTGDVMGTPYYMAPEQLKGQVVDHRADIFAVGVVAYELLTQRKAFDGHALTEVMLKVLSEDPPPMGIRWSESFPQLERLIGRAMAKSIDERYSTAADMKNAIAAFVADSRDAIARHQAEATVLVQRTAAEARTLIASGRIAESQALLDATLRSFPEAAELRRLHAETGADGISSRSYTDPAAEAATVVSPPHRPTPVVPPPSPPERTLADVTVQRGAQPPAWKPPVTTKRRESAWVALSRSRAMRWGGPVALLLMLSIAAIVTAQRGLAPATTPGAGPTTPGNNSSGGGNNGSGEKNDGGAGENDGSAGQNNGSAGAGDSLGGDNAAPGALNSGNGSTAVDGGGTGRQADLQGNEQPAGPRQGSGQGQSPTQSQSGRSGGAGLQVSAAINNDLSRALSTRLASALQERGIAPGTVRVSLDTSTRQAPFSGVAGVTADWVATVETREGVRTFEGHVLGFSELAVRNEVTNRAVEDIVTFLSGGANR